MRRTRIKICGVTRAEDALAAVDAGADAVGVVFADSSRQVSIEQAAEVLAGVPPVVARVGVFVDAPPAFVARAVRECGLTAVQFCGGESPEACASVSVPVVRMLSVAEGFDWEAAECFHGAVSALLLDTFVPGLAGGTARCFDWDSASDAPEWAKVFVAGGLTADNVGECIERLRPFAVDVSSGVESSPGIKDAEKMVAFCAAVRAADEEVRS